MAIGPNHDDHASANNLASPDNDLDKLVAQGSGSTYNAAVPEFDFVSTNSFTLKFHYFFASEEYPEWLGGASGYNDPMAIFVSTNYDGTNWIITTNNNIALVPGTSQPVSVNTINGGGVNVQTGYVLPSNPQYYLDNGDPTYSANAPVFNIQYDGTTVLLTAQVQVTANVTHHIKIGIEDYGDPAYDSTVFVKVWPPDSCCQCP